MSSLRTMRRPSTGDFQTEVRTVLPFHVTSRGRPTFTESSLGIPTWLKSSVWLESFLYNRAELRIRYRNLLLARSGHSEARTPLANPAHPKRAPLRTNQFQANRAGGPCAPTIRRRALQSHRSCVPYSFVPPGRTPSATQWGSEIAYASSKKCVHNVRIASR